MQHNSGFMRLVNALRYSWDGLRSAFASEAAFRQELLLFVLLTPIALAVDVSGGERGLMIGSLILVLIVEVINSAIEATVDRISDERHPLSKKAKDMGSAAVLLSLINAAAVWLATLAG